MSDKPPLLPPVKLPYILLSILLLLVLLSAYLFHTLYHSQQAVIHAFDKRYNAYVLANQLRRSSDELTRLVRTYVATGKPMYEQQFWEVLSIRNGEAPLPEHYDRVYWDFLAVEHGKPPFPLGDPESLKAQMLAMDFSAEDFSLLATSQLNSDRLVELEKQAINISKGHYDHRRDQAAMPGVSNKEAAMELLFGEAYHTAKIGIMEPINAFYEKLSHNTQQQVTRATSELSSSLAIQVFVFLLTSITILLLIVIARRYHRHAMQLLEEKVRQRTEQLTAANHKLQLALEDIKTLRGIIPICSYCHSVRDDTGCWEKLEAYISRHSDADFSHGVCPRCLSKLREDAGLADAPT